MSASYGGDTSAAKIAVRDQVLAARRRRGLTEGAAELAEKALAWNGVRDAASVAAYVSIGREPGTGLLLDELLAAGKRVLLPVLLPDNDLDWSVYTGSGDLRKAARGLLEPAGARLGVDAIRTVDMMLVPGLAVSASGDRLGRGGGSYDRALARVVPGIPLVVVLYDDEVGLPVPVEVHDRQVTHALTPSGVVVLSPASPGRA